MLRFLKTPASIQPVITKWGNDDASFAKSVQRGHLTGYHIANLALLFLTITAIMPSLSWGFLLYYLQVPCHPWLPAMTFCLPHLVLVIKLVESLWESGRNESIDWLRSFLVIISLSEDLMKVKPLPYQRGRDAGAYKCIVAITIILIRHVLA